MNGFSPKESIMLEHGCCLLLLPVLGLHVGPWNVRNTISEAMYENLGLCGKRRYLIYMLDVDT